MIYILKGAEIPCLNLSEIYLLNFVAGIGWLDLRTFLLLFMGFATSSSIRTID
jgi:hypothetical protein